MMYLYLDRNPGKSHRIVPSDKMLIFCSEHSLCKPMTIFLPQHPRTSSDSFKSVDTAVVIRIVVICIAIKSDPIRAIPNSTFKIQNIDNNIESQIDLICSIWTSVHITELEIDARDAALSIILA